jgi:predicted transcriptional regulator
MSTAELRNIITQYTNVADDKLLRIVKAVFESYTNEEADIYDELPETFQKLINKGLEDIKEGRVRSHEEVMKSIREKYNLAG